MTTDPSSDVVERLRRVRGYRVCECAVDKPINPDGPEAAATIERLSAEPNLLAWLAENSGLELTWGELDDDMSECAWRVHRRSGGYNDREWTLIATGETPLIALQRARAALSNTAENG